MLKSNFEAAGVKLQPPHISRLANLLEQSVQHSEFEFGICYAIKDAVYGSSTIDCPEMECTVEVLLQSVKARTHTYGFTDIDPIEWLEYSIVERFRIRKERIECLVNELRCML